MSGSVTSADSADTRPVRERAAALILQEAQKAAQSGDMERFDSLIARLPVDEGPMLDVVRSDAHRERRIDQARLAMAGLSVAGLIAIITYAIASHSDVAGQYVSLVSGLA